MALRAFLAAHLFAVALLSFAPTAWSEACPEVVRQYILAGQETIDRELLSFSAVISDNTGTCTATVLNNRYILTAAHCSYFPGATVRVGVTSTLERPSGKVKRFIKHPKYDGKSVVHDIAVVEIEPPIPSPTVVRLHVGATAKAGAYVRAAGYGVNTADFRTVPASSTGIGRFRRVDLPIVPIDKCKSSLEKNNIRIPPEFSATNYICAGFTTPGHCGGDTCDGDSGGPIVTKSAVDDKYVQIGVTSAGSGCGEQNIPGIYTNVDSHVDWVKEIAGDDIVTVNAFENPKPPPPTPPTLSIPSPAPSSKPLPAPTSSSTSKPSALPSPTPPSKLVAPSSSSSPSKNARAVNTEQSTAKALSSPSPLSPITSGGTNTATSSATNTPKLDPSDSSEAEPVTTEKPAEARPSSGPSTEDGDNGNAPQSLAGSPVPISGGGANASSKPGENVTVTEPADSDTTLAPNGDGSAVSGSQIPPRNASESSPGPTMDKSASVETRSKRKLSPQAVGAMAGIFSIIGIAVIAGGVFYGMRTLRASNAAAGPAAEVAGVDPATENV